MKDFASALSVLDALGPATPAAVVVTIIRDETSQGISPSSRMVVLGDGSVHGNLPTNVAERVRLDALESIADGTSQMRSYVLEGDTLQRTRPQQGQLDVYFDVLPQSPRLVVVGGGHIAVPLVRIAAVLEFDTVVLDDRAQYADPSRFPDAGRVLCGEYAETLGTLGLDKNTYVVLVTRGHVHDAACLREVIKHPVAYIGMIGSAMRVRTVVSALHTDGIAPQALENLYAPVGLDIHSTTPAEIAVAIVAEIVNLRRKGPAPSLRNRRR